MVATTPSVTESQERKQFTMPWAMFAGLVLHPLAFLGLMFVSWKLAASDLGRDPIPYQDDPRFLTDPIGQLHVVGAFLMLLAFVAVPVALATAVRRWVPGVRSRSFIPLAVWVASIVIMVAFSETFFWFID